MRFEGWMSKDCKEGMSMVESQRAAAMDGFQCCKLDARV